MKPKSIIQFVIITIALLILACGNPTLPTRAPVAQEITVVVESNDVLEEEVVVEVTSQRPREVTRIVTVNTPSIQEEVTRVVTVDIPGGSEDSLAEGREAVVNYVVDGDTIDVSFGGTSYRVRYIGMDTPERGDSFFEEATEANEALVDGETVILVKDVSETDQYGRLLRYVYLQDGTFVNAELVRQGFAVIATFPPDVRHQELFLSLEREAREEKRGLWAES